MNIKWLVKNAIIAAAYAALTTVFSFLSYGDIQFRIAEALLIFLLFDASLAPGIVLGTFLANLFSPLGIYDWVFGTLATIIAIYGLLKSKNNVKLGFLWVALVNGIIVAFELWLVFQLPILTSLVTVSFGELVVLFVLGYPLYLLLKAHNFELK